jgi:hypothetical protein
MVLIFEDIRFMSGFNLFTESVISFCQDARVIDASILSYCPTIELPIEEVHILGLNNVFKDPSSMSWQLNNSEPIIQEVCVDSYFSAKRAKSASTAINGFKICYMFDWLLIILSVCVRNTL